MPIAGRALPRAFPMLSGALPKESAGSRALMRGSGCPKARKGALRAERRIHAAKALVSGRVLSPAFSLYCQ